MNKERLFANIASSGFQTEGISLISEPTGNVSRTWIVADKNQHKWVAKEHPSWIKKNDIDWINNFTAQLIEKDYPVARLICPIVETESGFLGIYDYIDGQDYDAENQGHIVAMGSSLSKLHLLSSQIIVEGQRNWPNVSSSDFVDRYEKARIVLDTGVIINGFIGDALSLSFAAWKIAQEQMEGVDKRSIFPIHGDFHGANMRFSGNQVVGVFDFDNSRNDFPEADIAKAIRKISEASLVNSERNATLFLQAYFESERGIEISPDRIFASKLILEAHEVLYLCDEQLKSDSISLREDLKAETTTLSNTIAQQSQLKDLFCRMAK